MDLRVLQYFLAVAREQSITAAAESLHLSQPTLSTQLKALEEELGKQLLIRGARGSRKVVLTEEGMILRKRAEAALPTPFCRRWQRHTISVWIRPLSSTAIR